MQRPLPITAVAVCSGLGTTIAAHREALWQGQDGLGPPSMPLPFETVVGAIPSVLPALPDRWAARQTHMLQIAQQLIAQMSEAIDAVRGRVPAHRIALVLGTSTSGSERTELAYASYLRHGATPEEYSFLTQGTCGALLLYLREALGVEGPAWVISTACTSSGKSLACAQRLIASGAADAVFVGGVDTLCGMTLHGFHSLGALSTSACTPFSHGRSGLNIGEGGALLLIERAGTPLCMLEGVGESSDAHHISAPHPEGRGASEAMRAALQQAGAAAETVEYVNAHGTGTPLNDIAESLAITAVLGPDVPVVSTKSYTGHLLGAAGGVEAVLTLLSITEGFLPASLRCHPVDPDIAAHISTTRRTGRIRRALSNSFAFGGSNVSVLLGEPR